MQKPPFMRSSIKYVFVAFVLNMNFRESFHHFRHYGRDLKIGNCNGLIKIIRTQRNVCDSLSKLGIGLGFVRVECTCSQSDISATDKVESRFRGGAILQIFQCRL